MKNRKQCKLNILLFIILILAGTIFYAMFISQKNSTSTDSVGGITKAYKDHSSARGWYNLDDLRGSGNTTCSLHGGPLNSPSGDYIGTFPTVVRSQIENRSVMIFDFDEMKMVKSSLAGFDFSETSLGEQPDRLYDHYDYHAYGTRCEDLSDLGYDTLTVYSTGWYYDSSSFSADPMEAYILARTDFYYSNKVVKEAWWMTPTASSEGSATAGDNSLSHTAKAFRTYVYKLVSSGSSSSGNGFINSADYESNVTIISNKATVSFNENNQKYYIGPITIYYVDDSYGGVNFAYIDGAKLTTNLNTYKIDNHWKFVDIQGKYPANGEDAYIELDYIEGMTEIEGLYFDFKYMDAAGSGILHKGEIYQYNYKYKCEPVDYYATNIYECTISEDGNTTHQLVNHLESIGNPIDYDIENEYASGYTYDFIETVVVDEGETEQNVFTETHYNLRYHYDYYAGNFVYIGDNPNNKENPDQDEEKYVNVGWRTNGDYIRSSAAGFEYVGTETRDKYDTYFLVNDYKFYLYEFYYEFTDYGESPIKAQSLVEKTSGSTWYEDASKSDNTVIDLTMSMGGTVWDDTDKDGTIDSEKGIEGVKVTLYRVYPDGSEYKEALVYDSENNQKSNSTYTDSNGEWSFERVAIPATGTSGSPVYYSVYYEYDGQTYEPTSVVNVQSFINASTENRKNDKYLKSSMAQDKSDSAALITTSDDTVDRETFNESFTYIEGNSAINASTGKTSGVAYDESRKSSKTLNYSSQDKLSNYDTGNSRKVSTLDTVASTSSQNSPYSQYRLTAKTQYSNLLFPLDECFHIEDYDKNIGSNRYYAIYNYVNNINLGLVERKTADISVEKDLTEITTVVNGKVMKYEYDAALGIDDGATISDIIQKQLDVMDAEITYTLNVYRSDYYYRASIYDGTTVGDALDNFYKSIGFKEGSQYNYASVSRTGTSSAELEIYLTYTIRVHNENDEYDVRINNLTDYYDSTLTLINDEEATYTYSNVYVQTLNGEEVNDVVTLTKEPEITFHYADGKTDTSKFSWTDNIDQGTTEDGTKYTVAETDIVSMDPKGKDNNHDMKLSVGEYADLVTTYRVNKSTADNGVTNAIELGAKQNVAEVQCYTTYYSKDNTCIWADEGEIAGRVDGDSAPGNVNPDYLYDESLYEDDSDATSTLNIQLTEDPNRRRWRRWRKYSEKMRIEQLMV